MKATGPLLTIIVGLAVAALAWVAGSGPPDHNIGRGIATSVLSDGGFYLGGATAACGLLWLAIRWLSRPRAD